MKKKLLNFETVLILMGAFLLAACAGSSWSKQGMMKYEFRPSHTLKDGPFEIQLRKVYCGAQRQGYFVYVHVYNWSNQETIFDARDLRLKDTERGQVFQALTATQANEDGIGFYPRLITRALMQPGQRTDGYVFFPTQVGKAKAKDLILTMGDGEIKMSRGGPVTPEEWNAFFGGRI